MYSSEECEVSSFHRNEENMNLRDEFIKREGEEIKEYKNIEANNVTICFLLP
jgi:hypothetical protein